MLPPDLREARFSLRRFGVKFGRRAIFLPALLRPEAAKFLAVLWGAGQERTPPIPPAGITSFDLESSLPDGFLSAAGFRRVGTRAVRLDITERLEDELEAAVKCGATAEVVRTRLVSLLSCSNAALDDLMTELGWATIPVGSGDGAHLVFRRRSPKPRPRDSKGTIPAARRDPRSPFAGLSALMSVD